MSMRNTWRGLIIALLVAAPLLVASADDEKKAKLRFTVGKATTGIEGPLDKDGRIDYAAALNERLGKGVTAKTNANVLLWQAMGPKPFGGDGMPAEFFTLMRMDPPPENGDYFVDFTAYVQAKEDDSKVVAILERAAGRPWAAAEQPEVAAWLKSIEKPLALVVEATQRPHYFSPMVPPKRDNGPGLLIHANLFGVQKCRDLAKALTARAMLRLGKGEAAEAWADLLACHRLARLVSRGGTLIESLVGMALEMNGVKADIAFLDRAKPDAKMLENCVRDWNALTRMPALAEKIALGERYSFLDIIMKVDRDGLQALSEGKPAQPNALIDQAMKTINWDPALESVGKWYDRLAAICGEKDRVQRSRDFEVFAKELRAMKDEAAKGGGIPELLLAGKSTDKELGKKVGEILLGSMMPAVNRIADAADRCEQNQINFPIAFALARYRLDRGSYPKELAELAPKYLKEVPGDLFSRKPLVYHITDKGYQFYSVGPNGIDEGGRGSQDLPRGDDIGVNMPLAEMPKK